MVRREDDDWAVWCGAVGRSCGCVGGRAARVCERMYQCLVVFILFPPSFILFPHFPLTFLHPCSVFFLPLSSSWFVRCYLTSLSLFLFLTFGCLV